ncbi:MAG: GNAT family N-acetyltransferase [Chloroflexota bacterium]|nr:GNAT family N-acetyltransferase [Chloroflexota bacterium]
MEIQRVTLDDAEVVARIHIDSWRAAYRGLVPDEFLEKLDYDRRAERFRENVSSGLEETYLAKVNNKGVGILTIGGCRDEDVDQDITGEIWGIYLAPTEWRKGYGSALFNYGEQLLHSRGYNQLILWVFADNHQARRFYEAMGFEVDGASKYLDLGILLKVVRYMKEISC